MRVYAVLTPESEVCDIYDNEWSAKQLCDKLNAKRNRLGLYGIRTYEVKS